MSSEAANDNRLGRGQNERHPEYIHAYVSWRVAVFLNPY